MPEFELDEVEEEAKKNVISTGHGEIDKKLGGGIPIGSLTLVEGQSDAGKSVLCQQMIWGSLKNDFKVVLFTTENTVKSLVTQMDSLGLSMTDYLLLGRIKIYTMRPSLVRSNAAAALQSILDTMEDYEDFDLPIMDSITQIAAGATGAECLAYFERCKTLCDRGKTIINVAHTYAFEQDLLVRIRSICDAHFKLAIERVGDRLVKTLEVAKVRGATQTTGNVLSFDVEPEIGMKIMPLSRAKV
ncbi:MAG TPA: ATPase domain-containing protein [Dehalococcoidales bacterium]|nr:ATPase domain-containing protein [Dehalococcoidales bacterium]